MRGWDRATVGTILPRACHPGMLRQLLDLDHGPSIPRAFPNYASSPYRSLSALKMSALPNFFALKKTLSKDLAIAYFGV